MTSHGITVLSLTKLFDYLKMRLFQYPHKLVRKKSENNRISLYTTPNSDPAFIQGQDHF